MPEGCSVKVFDAETGKIVEASAEFEAGILASAPTLAQAKAARLAEVRAQAGSCIAANVPAPWDQLRDLASEEFRAWVEAFRELVAAELSRLETAVEAAATVAAVNAITADWPEVEA
jgi:hypothetical protein